LNIKVAIFNSHLAPIYYMRVKQYDYMWLSGNRRLWLFDLFLLL
jgi:hypothetical protein